MVARCEGIHTAAVGPVARWECTIRHAANELERERIDGRGSGARSARATSKDPKEEHHCRSHGGEVARSAGERPPSVLSSVASTGVPTCIGPAVGAYIAQQIRCVRAVCVCVLYRMYGIGTVARCTRWDRWDRQEPMVSRTSLIKGLVSEGV